MSSDQFSHLAEPIYIGKVRLKNRMMKNGTGLFWDDPTTGGFMNDKYIAFFEALAKGGAGLLVSATSPLQDGPLPGFKISTDEHIPGYRKLADAIHKYDCPAFLQLFHLGGMSPLFFKAPAGIAASYIPREISPRPLFEPAREITIPEIQDVIDRFASAAERTKKAGFDGTELNGGCNHLLNSFISRAWNKRQDEYGCQSMETRARIVIEIIKEIKRRNGKDWPLIMLMNAMEVDLKDGLTIQETKEFAKMFEQAGADAIEIRAEYYRWTNNVKRRDSTHFPDVYFYPEHPANLDDCVEGEGDGAGANLPMAAAIKKAVNIPVICMGKLDWNLGEKAIRDGKVDIISMNRRLLADPAVPKKVLEGRLDDITPCTSCMTCFNLGEHFQPVACRVNASLGHEREYEIKPAQTKKKVVVIGGGPAGMEAARVAALRGHEVILYDKEPKLGGSLPVASVVKGKDEDLLGLANYFSVQLDKLGVKVNTGVEASPDEIARIKPDVLIIAAGGLHDVPDIPGIKGSNVLTGPELHSKLKSFFKFMSPELIKKLSGTWLPMVGKNVVIIGGRLHGCQTAEFLIKRGRKVTIVDTGTEKEIGDGLIEVFLKPYLLYWLEDHGVQFFTEVKLEGVNSEGLEITDKDGTKKTIKADTVITALPLKPNSDLVKSMEGKAKEMYTIGDAKEPHLIFDAIADGARVGHSF